MTDSPSPGELSPEQIDRLNALFDAMIQDDEERAGQLLSDHPELARWQGLLRDIGSLGMQTLLASGPGDLDQTNPPFPDRIFGRYLLKEELGRGGMGVVYRAWQTDLERPVAIKMILGGQLAREDQVRRFQSEARVAAQVRHPLVVTIHEVGQIDGQHFYAMEFVDGVSLDRYLASRDLDVKDACRWLIPVIRAVSHLHEHGIIHRDLKPGNLIVDRDGRLHVADFGLATLLNPDVRQTASGTVLGTPAYMAPEQAAGRIRELSPAVDLYSLGAILYEMLAGRRVHEDDSPARLLLQVIEREPQPVFLYNSRVPRPLWWILRRCLEKDPARRYANASALADDLERFLLGEPVEAGRGGWSQELQRIARRHPPVTYRLIAIGAALLIVLMRVLESPEHSEFYRPVLGAIVAWGILVLCWEVLWQRWTAWREAVSTTMTFTDVAVLTHILWLTRSVDGPVVALFHIVISAAGLSLRASRVWLAVGASLLGYGLLMLQPPEAGMLRLPHLSVLFALSLIVCGAISGFHARRLSMLEVVERDRSEPS